MSLPEGETYQSVLKDALLEAGLPAAPRLIVGSHYRFGCKQGSHHHILSGMVQAIELSDEGGLELHVSNPRFWGEPLMSIMFYDSKWWACVRTPSGKTKEVFQGEFVLL